MDEPKLSERMKEEVAHLKRLKRKPEVEAKISVLNDFIFAVETLEEDLEEAETELEKLKIENDKLEAKIFSNEDLQ